MQNELCQNDVKVKVAHRLANVGMLQERTVQMSEGKVYSCLIESFLFAGSVFI